MKEPLWTWTYEAVPAMGGTEESVALTPRGLVWKYTEDRWGKREDQTLESFIASGPVWAAPAEVVREILERLNIPSPAWFAEPDPSVRKPTVIWRD